MSKQRSLTTHAIVLNRRNNGEADRLVTLYTKEEGRLLAVAKSVRKLKSKNGALLEPGNMINCQLIKTKSLPIITQTDLLDEFAGAKKSLTKMRQLSQILEISDRLFIESIEDAYHFEVIVQILQELNKPESHLGVVKHHLTTLLTDLGFMMEGGSVLESIEKITDKPMRSWDYLTLK